MAKEEQRTAKAGDKVHAVCHSGRAGARFEKVHRDAKVVKVHDGGRLVDLVVPHESGDPDQAIALTKSPRDDAGQQPDSWHFPEAE